MAKQTVNVGVTDNVGTGSTIRAGGQIINSNFTEVYSTLGDGSTITFDLSGATNGQALVYNSSTGKFEPGTAAVSSDFIISGDGGADQTISTGDTLNVQGGTGITTTAVATDTLTIAVDATVATASSSTTFTNKTIDANGTGNSITNLEVADLASGVLDTDLSSVSASDDTLASAKAIKAYVDTQTASQMTTFTISDDSSTTSTITQSDTLQFLGGTGIGSTVSGDTVTFAIDNTVVTTSGTQTLTNKTIDSASNTLTLDLSEGTLTGTTAEFNTALSDGSFATLAGTETLSNKTINSSNNTITIDGTEATLSNI